jgi:phosphoribosyl-AMP cyclohydrolase
MGSNNDLESKLDLDLQFEKRGGLIPAIAQDCQSKEILMLGYVNPQALEETLKTGKATFWSTSRNELWTKGKISGDYLSVQGILVDCDQDAIIYLVERMGSGACHTKDAQGRPRRTCFYRTLEHGKLKFVSGLE